MAEYLIALILSTAAMLLGMALLACASRRSETDFGLGDSLGSRLLLLGWILALLGSLGLFGVLANVIGFLLWLALLVVLAMAFTQRRVGRRRMLLRLLAAAARGGRPLSPAVAAFAQESRGALKQQALRLHAALECGTPLASALGAVGPLQPTRERALIYVGQQTNELATALDEAANSQEPDPVAGEFIARLAYLLALLVVAVVVLTFVMLKIVPAYKQIFEDFATELPAITQTLISLSDLAATFWPLMLGFKVMLWGTFIYTLLLYVGWIRWHVPLPIAWSGLDTSVVLRGLALAAERGRPLDQGIEALAAVYPSYWIRDQLEQVGSDVAAGMTWWESLRLRGLISKADRSLLQAAQRLGNVPWALRAIADQHRWRFTYRLGWLLHLLAPPLMALVGVVLGFVVIALFMPLIKILEHLT